MKELEKLSNSELQKLYAKDKARGREQVWARRSHKIHLENLRKIHESSRGSHGQSRSKHN